MQLLWLWPRVPHSDCHQMPSYSPHPPWLCKMDNPSWLD